VHKESVVRRFDLRVCAVVLVQSSPEIRAWMREHDVSSIAGLETYFEERVLALASAAGRSYIIWQVGHVSLLPVMKNFSSTLHGLPGARRIQPEECTAR
jgi:hypothetical protein